MNLLNNELKTKKFIEKAKKKNMVIDMIIQKLIISMQILK